MRDEHDRPHNVGFILIPGFALMSYAATVESLRAANDIAGRQLYRFTSYAPAAGAVMSSSGAQVDARPLTAALEDDLDFAFACAGGEPFAWQIPEVESILRQLRIAGVRVGGISGGPFVLAAAGLLENRRFTIHWEHRAALSEAFPHLVPEPRRFVIDRDCYTCGGGIAPLDMMHAVIAEQEGNMLARQVSDWFLQTSVQPGQASQRSSTAERFGVRHPVLLKVLERMEATIEAPMTRAAMASHAGVSPRHLQRLFRSHMGSTYATEYRERRFEHANRLLKESPLTVSEIALATGFSSASHFSSAFKKRFGIGPHAMRNRGEELATPGETQ